jgi:hypothetical protein
MSQYHQQEFEESSTHHALPNGISVAVELDSLSEYSHVRAGFISLVMLHSCQSSIRLITTGSDMDLPENKSGILEVRAHPTRRDKLLAKKAICQTFLMPVTSSWRKRDIHPLSN